MKFQFRLATAMVAVAAAGVVMAGLRSPLTHQVSESLLLIVWVSAALGGIYQRGRWQAFWIAVAIVCAFHIVQPFSNVLIGIGLIDPWKFAELWTYPTIGVMTWWHSLARTGYILTVSVGAGLLSVGIYSLANPGSGQVRPESET